MACARHSLHALALQPPFASPLPNAATAVQKIVMELTLLGFVSLLLTALSRPLGHMCGELGTFAL